ncbi:MAG: hypothetical protein EB153_08055, partial [Nitrosopumilaceae archaeon]|nr:hypothetical protein [Nitrosopumilaceae archaeon]
VIVSLQATKDFKESQGFPQSPYGGGPGVMGFTNMDDMMKSLNKMLGGMGGMPGNMTTMKLDMREYKELSLSVGDKVYLEISKAETSGI